jgi:ribulose-phosphate 3-epimerase
MVGLTLNPDTSIEELKPFLNLVDFIQFMTVRPGFQGRDFLYYVVKKIDFFHKLYPNILIAVDGGINPSTARESVAAGASILISGSFILKSGNVGKAIEQLKKIVENK